MRIGCLRNTSLYHRKAWWSSRVADAGQSSCGDGYGRSGPMRLLHFAAAHPGRALAYWTTCDAEASIYGLPVGGRWVMSRTTRVSDISLGHLVGEGSGSRRR